MSGSLRPEGQDAVGWRVRVFWEDEECWFDGVVTEYTEGKGYFVIYDDGDEKWQETNDIESMEFVSNTIGISVEARMANVNVEEQAKVVEMPFATLAPPESPEKTNYSDDGFDHHEDNNESHESPTPKAPPEAEEPALPVLAEADEVDSPRNKSSPGTPNSSEGLKSTVEREPQEQPKFDKELAVGPPSSMQLTARDGMTLRKAGGPQKKAKPKPIPGLFYRDKETLVEMKAKLEARKKALSDELARLKTEVSAAESTSVTLKQTIADLTTKLTVAQLQTRPAPPTKPQSVDEQMLELEVKKRLMIKETNELKAAMVDVKKRVDERKKKLQAAQAELNSLPDYCRYTLAEAEIEKTNLLKLKASLEAELREQSPAAVAETAEAARLKQELVDCDTRMQSLKAESRYWKRLLEQELAKIEPLKARHASIQAQLARFRESKTLLRVAFDHIDVDKNGTLSLDETVQVLKMLVPPTPNDSGDADVGVTDDRVRAYFAQSDTNHDQRVDFNEFCLAFERLCKT
ncbi:Aste57867_14046 [Aphanomyces stellatus]|uniref:Aste57867_14046 protein n=1 Tax=Aphanomyces stellatus TaxID=120398 RepID=A0A485L083_9STRA|nr:hypothetical protein As57867_013995 [Aphanomyces stellatus]VFT90876.1 Aste57867_14046 [Aphanomyces stellatus]